MEAPRIRSRILVVALLLFVTGSALAWDRTWRRATSPEPDRPAPDCYMAIEHGGRIVRIHPAAAAQRPPPPRPVRSKRVLSKRVVTPVPTAPTIEVRNGDNLHRVAGRALGDSSRWREIAELNDMDPPYVIQPGQILDVPTR